MDRKYTTELPMSSPHLGSSTARSSTSSDRKTDTLKIENAKNAKIRSFLVITQKLIDHKLVTSVTEIRDLIISLVIAELTNLEIKTILNLFAQKFEERPKSTNFESITEFDDALESWGDYLIDQRQKVDELKEQIQLIDVSKIRKKIKHLEDEIAPKIYKQLNELCEKMLKRFDEFKGNEFKKTLTWASNISGLIDQAIKHE